MSTVESCRRWPNLGNSGENERDDLNGEVEFEVSVRHTGRYISDSSRKCRRLRDADLEAIWIGISYGQSHGLG